MLTKTQPTPLPLPDPSLEIVKAVGRAALAAAWAANSPGVREVFLSPASQRQLQRTWVHTEDGWEIPLWRRAPRASADGAPVLLATGPGLRPGALDLRPDRSLVEALHRAGFDVYLFSHRGDRDARPPTRPQPFDFDDVVAHDLQATINAIQKRTNTQRVLFAGHGLGGLLFVAHLARGGRSDLASGVTLGSPVRFDKDVSHARSVHRVARLLPSQWHVPHRAIQRWLLATGHDSALHNVAQQVEGPTLRRIALDESADLSGGLIRQIAMWHKAGHLCDRDNRFDDLAALEGQSFPLLTIAGDADPICTPEATSPLTEALKGSSSRVLTGGWSHLDTIAGPNAAREVFPQVVSWLSASRRLCWKRDM